MLGHVKTQSLYVARISLLKDKTRARKSYKIRVLSELQDETEAGLCSLDGMYKFVTQKGFVADEEHVLDGANSFAYQFKTFREAFPQYKGKSVSKLTLKRLERKLNKEQQ